MAHFSREPRSSSDSSPTPVISAALVGLLSGCLTAALARLPKLGFLWVPGVVFAALFSAYIWYWLEWKRPARLMVVAVVTAIAHPLAFQAGVSGLWALFVA